MNQVLLEDEDRNEPRGLLYDIQGERVPDKKFPIFVQSFLLAHFYASLSRNKWWLGCHYEFTKLDFSNARKSLTQEILICENTIVGAHAWLQYLAGKIFLFEMPWDAECAYWMFPDTIFPTFINAIGEVPPQCPIPFPFYIVTW